ncbi:MAG: hypothetical protein O7G32_06620 [SAR324 cluster bacterium]|nr:hypothetical protein [SAR324 cluster bacterium]
MSEEQQVDSAESPEIAQEEPTEESVTELDSGIEIQAGNAPAEVLEKLQPVCARADQIYNQILGLIKEFKQAESVLQQFHSRADGVTSSDVEEAKNKFQQAKQSYMELGDQINGGIKEVNTVAQTWTDDLLIQNVYKTYLAKLLASLETRNPNQNFVELLAGGAFDLERRPIPGGTGEGRDEDAEKQYLQKQLEETNHAVTMLEVRYQKRQLANRLRRGDSPARIIGRLVHLLHRDPDDINSYIWMANLLTNKLKTERDQNKRMQMRDEILDYCKRGFAIIDDYLNLQKIESLNERDRMRAEYVKTITSIRKPLMEQG